MSKVLIIGAGGVGQVVTHKCAQRRDIFTILPWPHAPKASAMP
jgi:saccharopine dehydrogenase (NAD+, L-lysine-forming)